MSLILRCPNCELYFPELSHSQIVNIPIAKLRQDGIIEIRRTYRKPTGETYNTLIIGNDFSVVCDLCNKPVFQKTTSQIQLGTLILTQSNFQAMIGTI